MTKYTDILKIISEKNVELRHDVDVSLVSAYNIAKVDKDFGIKSTFYIRFDCDYYNPISIDSKKMLDFISEHHKIGCHVDCTEISNSSDLLQYLERFNALFPFEYFTFHINTEKTKSFGHIGRFKNKSIITGEYISDSRGILSIDFIDKIKNMEEYTLLLHPEWWDNEHMQISEDRKKSIIGSMRFESVSYRIIKEILNYE